MTAHDPFRGASGPTALVGDAAPVLTIPDGSVSDIIDWIEAAGTDDERLMRADLALRAEQARENPRKGVVNAALRILHPEP